MSRLDDGGGVRDEWLVTGDPGGIFPPYEYVYTEAGGPDPERRARAFIEAIREGKHGIEPWTDGPHLHRRTVVVGEWRREET